MKNKNVLLFNLIAPIYVMAYNKQKKKYKKELKQLDIDFMHTKIIDVGCGTGALCSVLKDIGAEPIGIDSANNMIKLAKKKDSRIRFITANISEIIPFDDTKFDIGIASYVAHGFKKDERIHMYNELKRVSKDYVIIYDYDSKGNLLNMIIETLERSDYKNFIKNAKEEMESVFNSVSIIKAKKNKAWYICKI